MDVNVCVDSRSIHGVFSVVFSLVSRDKGLSLGLELIHRLGWLASEF